MKRREFLLSGTASAAALTLSACGGGGSPAEPGSPALATTALNAQASGGASIPFGSRVATYVAGIKPTQSASTMDALLASQYDAWKAARVVSVPNIVAGGYVIRFSDPNFITVSEGMGYGMLLAVLFAGHDPNAQQLFDGLLAVVRARNAYGVAQYVPAGKYLMDWRLNADGTSGGAGWSACDGDLDIALALLMADKQWGSSGTWNYKQEALNQIGGLKAWNMDAATASVGGMGVSHAGSARISDFMFGHFRAFKAATGDTFWDQAITKNQATLTYLQQTYSPNAGLLPDWAVNVTGSTPAPSPGFIGDGIAQEGDYWWNSCRDPWRLGTDYVLSGDATTKAICARIVNFFQQQVNAAGGDVMAIGTGYDLAGNKLTGGNSAAYHAPIMLGACIDGSYQAFADAMWNWNASHLTTGYYDSEIQLLSMVVASGNWWSPASVGGSSATTSSTGSTSTSNTGTSSSGSSGTTTTPPAATGNILSNGTFSNGLAGWNNWGNAAVAAGALRVGTAAGGVAQDIATKLTAGTAYTVNATANMSASAEGMYIGVKLFDAKGNVLVNQVKQVSALTSTAVSMTFTAPQGAASGYVYVWKNASTAYAIVSSMQLTPAASASTSSSGSTNTSTGTTATGTNLVANGTFSNGLAGWNNWGNSAAANNAVQVGTGAGGLAQDIAAKLKAGGNYKLTATANITTAAEGVWVGVKLMDSAGNIVVNQAQLVSSTAASNVSLAFTMPANAVSGYVYVWKNANAAYGVVTNVSVTAA